MGKFDKLAKFLGLAVEKYGDDAAKIIEKVDSPELATSLKGIERGQYLKALDEVYGSQAKRAEQMGFSPETYYHGTGRSFEQFDPKYLGSVTGEGLTKGQHWFSSNPKVSEIFAKQAGKESYTESLRPLLKQINDDKNKLLTDLKEMTGAPRPEAYLTMSENLLNRMLKAGEIDDSMLAKIKDFKSKDHKARTLFFKNAEKGTNIIPVKLNLQNIKEIDAKNQFWENLKNEIGNEEIKVKNLREGSNDIFNSEMPIGNSVGMTDPSKIRSQFAAFDPRFKESSLLMAGGLAAPTGQMDISEQMNPLDKIKTGLSYYEKAKEAVSKPLASQLNIGKNPQDEAFINEALKVGIDPVNYISGPLGAGLGAVQLLTPSEDEIKKRVLKQMAGGQ